MEQIKVRGDVPSLGVPMWDYQDKSYHKGLLECTINILKDITDKLSKVEPENRKTMEQDNIPMQYVHTLIDMADVMCHMINSTSWREAELKGFDAIELKRRLDKISHWMNVKKIN